MTEALSPSSLAEAVALLAERPGLRPVAGCTDLMVCEPEERADLPAVMNLLGIPELRGIEETARGVRIGAATPFTDIRGSSLVRERFPALAAAAAVVGGWQIQNRATIGGNVVNASPAGDSLPVLLALGATAMAAGAAGEREIPYAEFHVGYRRTALRPDELLVALLLPPPAPGRRQLFRKVGTREAQAISKVVVALDVEVRDGRLYGARLGAGSVAPVPVRLGAAEEVLEGAAADVRTAEAAAAAAAGAVEPIDDVRSTAGYRRWVLGRVVRRMVLSLG